MFALIVKRSIWIAVAVFLVAIFISRFQVPYLDDLLARALNPVEELEVWRR